MNRVVVDTDVVSFLFKNHPIANRYDPELCGRIPLISFMTVADAAPLVTHNRTDYLEVPGLMLISHAT